jgi:transmembrane sensor
MDKETRRLEELLAQQASQWIETLRDPSAQQRAAFVAWLKDSPRNVRDFLLMLTIDQSLDTVDSKRLHDIESLLAAADTRVVDFPRMRVRRKAVETPRRRWKAAAVAASVVFASVMSWLAWDYRSAHWTEFETATGEQRAFELEDGSVVHLNTHSRAAIRFSERTREVRLLHGEALFRVRHDASRPFRVYTADAVIQAVGTQFNVYERPEGTVVAVIEGRVSVEAVPAANAAAALMRAGGGPAHHSAAAASAPAGLIVRSSEEAKINHAGNVSVQADLDVAEAVAWRERRLIFREQRLDVIAEQFNRYSRKQIRLEGPEVMTRLYTGVFDADDVESLAQILMRDPQLIVESSNQAIVVRAR